jgi:hypothetical protein
MSSARLLLYLSQPLGFFLHSILALAKAEACTLAVPHTFCGTFKIIHLAHDTRAIVFAVGTFTARLDAFIDDVLVSQGATIRSLVVCACESYEAGDGEDDGGEFHGGDG